MKVSGTVLFGLLVLALPSQHVGSAQAQGIESWNPKCAKLLKEYKKRPRHKAFAASNPNSGGSGAQACGVSWSYPSAKQARDAALKSCNTQRGGTCWITKSE